MKIDEIIDTSQTFEDWYAEQTKGNSIKSLPKQMQLEIYTIAARANTRGYFVGSHETMEQIKEEIKKLIKAEQ